MILSCLLAVAWSEDLYEALGVARTANPSQIRAAYRKAALKHHPDKAGGDGAATDKFIALSKAYEVLSDADKRRVYDAHGEAGLAQLEGRPAPDAGRPSNPRAAAFADAEELFRAFFGLDDDREAAAEWAQPGPPQQASAGGAGGARASKLGRSRFAAGASARTMGQGVGARGEQLGAEERAGARAAAPPTAPLFSPGSLVRHADQETLAQVLQRSQQAHEAYAAQRAGPDAPPVQLLFLHGAPTSAAAHELLRETARKFEDVAAVGAGIVQVWAVDDPDAIASLGVEPSQLPAAQALSARGRLRYGGALESGEVIGRFALMALLPGSVPLAADAELDQFHTVCARATCGCAVLLPARAEPSPLWHALGQRLAAEWGLAHAADERVEAAWARELDALRARGDGAASEPPVFGVLSRERASGGARFEAVYTGPPAYAPVRKYLDGICARRNAAQ